MNLYAVCRRTYIRRLPQPAAFMYKNSFPYHKSLYIAKKEEICHQKSSFSMSGKRDSNPRPSAWEADALPTELLPHCFRFRGTKVSLIYEIIK